MPNADKNHLLIPFKDYLRRLRVGEEGQLSQADLQHSSSQEFENYKAIERWGNQLQVGSLTTTVARATTDTSIGGGTSGSPVTINGFPQDLVLGQTANVTFLTSIHYIHGTVSSPIAVVNVVVDGSTLTQVVWGHPSDERGTETVAEVALGLTQGTHEISLTGYLASGSGTVTVEGTHTQIALLGV